MSKFKNTIDGDKYYDDMDNAQRARWMSLLVAIDTEDDKCHNSGISFDDVDLSPIAIKHFINSVSFLFKLLKVILWEIFLIDTRIKIINKFHE